MISTCRLDLLPLAEEDTDLIVNWRNTDSIISQLFSSGKLTVEQHKKWFENYNISDTRREFIINIRESSFKIGTIGLSNIDLENRKAEYGILIGETAFEGKGYAKEASEAILKYSFDDMLLNKVYLKVFADNYKAIALYKKLGFSEEGHLRDDIYKDNAFRDVVIMSILSKDWKIKYENGSIQG